MPSSSEKTEMVTVVQLASPPDPKRVTAQQRPDNLEEHLRGFLAANNQFGFHADMNDVVAPLADLLWRIGQRFGTNRKGYSKTAHEIKIVTRMRIRHQAACQLLANLYGYRSHQDALAANPSGDFIKNMRYGLFNHTDLFSPVDKNTLIRAVGKGKTIVVQDQEREGYKSSELQELVQTFCEQYRFGRMRVEEKLVRDYAAQRFFGLDKYNSLKRYTRRGEIPPFFKAVNVEDRENKLALMMIFPQSKGPKTIEQVAKELRIWCESDEIFNELQRALLFMVEGNQATLVSYWTRQFGVCGVRVVPVGRFKDRERQPDSLAFLIKNEKITQILIQKYKEKSTQSQ
jgi:hypothetical protein